MTGLAGLAGAGRLREWQWRMPIGIALALIAWLPGAVRADTVASLLGNFTINQYCGLRLEEKTVEVHYAVVFGQLPAIRELHLADVDGDGVTTEAERNAYARKLAPEIARALQLTLDGRPLPLELTHWASSLPSEQGGFSLRLDATFVTPLPAAALRDTHVLRLVNDNYAGRLGWHEISIETTPALHVFDTNGFADSLTAGLTQALQSLPAAGPLDERQVHLAFTSGPPPPNAIGLGRRARDEASPPQSVATPSGGEAAWLEAQTRRLVERISAARLEPRVVAITLLLALLLGAVHALSPGHGKTLVGAYLIGSRGTARHAVFLGATVTVTHTLGVFALGFATLFASRYVVPEKLFPVLSLISGLMIFGMGIVLFATRWHQAKGGGRGAQGLHRSPSEVAPHLAAASPLAAGELALATFSAVAPSAAGHTHGGALHSHGHAHSHHGLAHSHGSAAHSHAGVPHSNEGLMHSHGGSFHTHLPPGADGARVSWRSLLTLGISGGLIPCPSAMVLLLAAIALNKTLYGLLLVLTFSLGLAATLTLIGLLFLYARSRIRLSPEGSGWMRWAPVMSAGVIAVIGAMLCVNALTGSRW